MAIKIGKLFGAIFKVAKVVIPAAEAIIKIVKRKKGKDDK